MLVGDTPGIEQREIEEVAAVHRQVLHFGLRNRARDLAARRLEHGRFAVTVTLVSSARDASAIGRSNAEPTVSVSVRVSVRKSLHADDHFVRPDFEIGKPEPPFRIRHGFRRDVGLGLPGADLRAGHDARPEDP